MGCFQSRLDKRGDQASDFNVTSLAFLGGNAKEIFDNFPVDRILWAFNKDNNKDKEADAAELFGGDAGFTASNEEQVTAVYKEVMKALDDEHKALSEKFPAASDAKDQFYAGKYKAQDAVKQLADTIENLKTKSGLHKEEAAAATDAAAAMEPAAMEDAMMEGGDENAEEADVNPGAGMMAMESSAPNPNKYEEAEEFEGWAKFGGALLRNAIVNPVFGDLLRSHAISADFNPEKFSKNGYTGAAALVSALAAKNESAEKEYWMSGYITEDYLASLNDIVADKSNIHFPWLVSGWATEAEAKAALLYPEPEKKDNYTKVLFHVTKAKTFDFAKCRVVSHRLQGLVTQADSQDDIKVFNIEAKDLPTISVAAWEEAKKAAATPVAAMEPAADKDAAMEPAAAMEMPAAEEMGM